MGHPGGAKQSDKSIQVLAGQVRKLTGMAVANRLAHFVQEGQAHGRDADANNAAIVGRPVADDEAALLQLVEQPGDVGSPADETTGQVERPHGTRPFAAEQAEGVVLLRRQVVPGEQFVLERPQAIISPPEVEERFLFERVEAFARSGRPGRHAVDNTCSDKCCPDIYQSAGQDQSGPGGRTAFNSAASNSIAARSHGAMVDRNFGCDAEYEIELNSLLPPDRPDAGQKANPRTGGLDMILARQAAAEARRKYPLQAWTLDLDGEWSRTVDLEFSNPDQPRGQPDNAGKFAKTSAPRQRNNQRNESAASEFSAVTPFKLTTSAKRAFFGQPVPLKNPISKQEAGRIGEQIVIAYWRDSGMKNVRYPSLNRRNFPIDLIHDSACIEVKTGLVSNSPGAQKWRMTIGEPGKKEKVWLEAASSEEKAEWNQRKQRAIHDRKRKELVKLSKKVGKKLDAKTVTVLLNSDTRTVDIFEFDGWHDRIAWNSETAKMAYKGSFRYATAT